MKWWGWCLSWGWWEIIPFQSRPQEWPNSLTIRSPFELIGVRHWFTNKSYTKWTLFNACRFGSVNLGVNVFGNVHRGVVWASGAAFRYTGIDMRFVCYRLDFWIMMTTKNGLHEKNSAKSYWSRTLQSLEHHPEHTNKLSFFNIKWTIDMAILTPQDWLPSQSMGQFPLVNHFGELMCPLSITMTCRIPQMMGVLWVLPGPGGVLIESA